MFIGTLILVPLIVTWMPANYFVRREPPPDSWRSRHPLVRYATLILKNLLGMIFLAAGVVMIFTPGQGLLCIFLGISLLNFPGKWALERRLLHYRPIYNAINRIRKVAGRPPLELPPRE